jgi:hypothetical protein
MPAIFIALIYETVDKWVSGLDGLGRTASKLETSYLRFRITSGAEENQQRKRAPQRPLEIQGDAMKGEFRPHRFQAAPMKPLEALAFAQFGKAMLGGRS